MKWTVEMFITYLQEKQRNVHSFAHRKTNQRVKNGRKQFTNASSVNAKLINVGQMITRYVSKRFFVLVHSQQAREE